MQGDELAEDGGEDEDEAHTAAAPRELSGPLTAGKVYMYEVVVTSNAQHTQQVEITTQVGSGAPLGGL